ncbi:ABC transporter ATP-binding protein [Streptosporangium sp. NPDC004631]
MIGTKVRSRFAAGRAGATAPVPGASVRLEHIVKRYADTAAVAGVSLDIEAGQFVTLLGASGSGKTTLLRVIAGFVEATSGRVVLDGEDISQVPVHRRHIGMVFQNYALFPHMSVAKNVAFPLEMRRVARHARPALVKEALEAVHLDGFERRLPRELSGGQQQRVALARAVVGRPRLLLMDEPLGALDRRLREAMQLEIRRLSRELGLTVVNVTHDQEEALTMSDRIALLAKGRLVQFGTPAELYTRPNSEIVARFLGESNMFRGPVRVEDGRPILDLPHGRVVVPSGAPDGGGRWREAIVAVRPSAVRIGRAGSDTPDGESFMPGEVTACVYAGDSYKIVIDGAVGTELIVRCDGAERPPCEVGDRVILTWNETAGVAIPADR